MTTDDQTSMLLRALVALQIAERQERQGADSTRPSELVLADAGLSLSDIADLTGRKYDSVKTTIRRARAAHSQPSTTKTKAKKGQVDG